MYQYSSLVHYQFINPQVIIPIITLSNKYPLVPWVVIITKNPDCTLGIVSDTH